MQSFPSKWLGLHMNRLGAFTTRLANRPVPLISSGGDGEVGSGTSALMRACSSETALVPSLWYMEVALGAEAVNEGGGGSSSSGARAGAVGVGLVRLPDGGGTFGLDERRAMLADTETLSGAGALPGLVPSSCAYLSTGEVLLDGSSLPPNDDASSGRLPSPSGLLDGEDGDGGLFDEGRGSDTPQNPSGTAGPRADGGPLGGPLGRCVQGGPKAPGLD